MTIETVVKKIHEADKESKDIRDSGMQGYQGSIDNLKAIQKLCKYAVILLEKCRAKGTPFQEYEILLKKNDE